MGEVDYDTENWYSSQGFNDANLGVVSPDYTKCRQSENRSRSRRRQSRHTDDLHGVYGEQCMSTCRVVYCHDIIVDHTNCDSTANQRAYQSALNSTSMCGGIGEQVHSPELKEMYLNYFGGGSAAAAADHEGDHPTSYQNDDCRIGEGRHQQRYRSSPSAVSQSVSCNIKQEAIGGGKISTVTDDERGRTIIRSAGTTGRGSSRASAGGGGRARWESASTLQSTNASSAMHYRKGNLHSGKSVSSFGASHLRSASGVISRAASSSASSIHRLREMFAAFVGMTVCR